MGGKGVAEARAFPIREISSLGDDVTGSPVSLSENFGQNIDFFSKNIFLPKSPWKSSGVGLKVFAKLFSAPKDNFIRKFVRTDLYVHLRTFVVWDPFWSGPNATGSPARGGKFWPKYRLFPKNIFLPKSPWKSSGVGLKVFAKLFSAPKDNFIRKFVRQI